VQWEPGHNLTISSFSQLPAYIFGERAMQGTLFAKASSPYVFKQCMEDTQVVVGVDAEIHGLQCNVDLNGQNCVLQNFTGGRWQVYVKELGRLVRIRGQNLLPSLNWGDFAADASLSNADDRPPSMSDKTDPALPLVEQHVFHSEPAQQIDELEASLIVSEQEAGFIEHLIMNGTDSLGSGLDESVGSINIDTDKVHIVKLSRNSKELRNAFCEGRPLQRCRSALNSHGHSWKLVTGTLVFVHPEIYRDVMTALIGMALQPDEIVFSEEFENSVEETLSSVLFGSKGKRSWARSRSEVPIRATDESTSAAMADECVLAVNWSQALTVKRTFVCPARSSHSGVVESLPLGFQHENPRRRVVH
jgi:hypothetical protein